MANGPKGTEIRRQTAIRITDSEKREIRKRAQDVNMTFSAYLISKALDRDTDAAAPGVRRELENINKRLDHLEKITSLAYEG